MAEYKLSYTANEINDRLGQVSKTKENVEQLTSKLNEEIRTRQSEIAVERARIDKFTALGEGSTAGDAELQDIRVAHDGTTYDTAGEAVRGQIGRLSEEIDGLRTKKVTIGKNRIDLSKATVNGYLLSDGSIKTNSKYLLTDFIDVIGEEKISTSYTMADGTRSSINPFFLGEYDSNGVMIKYTESPAQIGCALSPNTVKIRFSILKTHSNEIMMEFGSKITDYEPYSETIEYEIKKDTLPNFASIYNWENMKWVAFGDSLTDDRNIKATKRYFNYIAEETGINVLNYGVSGSGYTKDGESAFGSDTNWMDRVLTLANVDFDVITFFGSGNDLSSDLPRGTATDTTADTRCGCINITLDNLLSVKPFAKIGIITPTPWQSTTPWGEDVSMTKYCDLLIEIAKRRGIPYLDLYRCSQMYPDNEAFRNAFYSRDGGNGVHPDENGHKRFYPQIREFLKRLI